MSDTIKRLRLLETHLSNSGKPVWSRDVKRAANELAALQARVEAAEAEAGKLRERNAKLVDVVYGVVALEFPDHGRTYPSKSLIEKARAALQESEK
jgi:hypothetical protein